MVYVHYTKFPPDSKPIAHIFQKCYIPAHNEMEKLFQKLAGAEGAQPSPPIPMGGTPNIPETSGGEGKLSRGQFGCGDP